MARKPQQDEKMELLNDDQVWEITHETLSEYVSLDVQGDVYTTDDLFDVLLKAASGATTIERACDDLGDIGSGNGIRYHLRNLEVEKVEEEINAALVAHLPKGVLKRPRNIAVDIVLVPYYGTVDEEESDFLIRSQARAGTTHFFGYATLYLLHKNERYTLTMRCVRNSESLLETLCWLLDRFEALGGLIKRLYLDAGFYQVRICRYLIEERDIPFLMPAPKKGRRGGIRKLCNGPRTYRTDYTMQSPKDGRLTVPVILVKKYNKGKYGRHGVRWFAYVAYRWNRSLMVVYEDYRRRFGIESSYALLHAVRARIRSRKPSLRCLVVGLALLLVNVWVYLKWSAISLKRRGGRQVLERLFPFKRMCFLLQMALLRRHGANTSIQVSKFIITGF